MLHQKHRKKNEHEKERMSKHIELAKKLKALADKGVGGEKINAKKMLRDVLRKNNLTLKDIEGEKTYDYFFKLKDGEERLWNQIVSRVNHGIKRYGKFPDEQVKEYELKGNYMITCTIAEYVEIESMLNIYQRLYREELEIFFSAFCKANDLLVKSKKLKNYEDLTEEEKEEWWRVSSMATKIKSETYRKQIAE